MKAAMKSNTTTSKRCKEKAQSVDDKTLPASTSHDESDQDSRSQDEPTTSNTVHDQDVD